MKNISLCVQLVEVMLFVDIWYRSTGSYISQVSPNT